MGAMSSFIFQSRESGTSFSCEFIANEHMIENVAFVVGRLAATHGDSSERALVLQSPRHFIDTVAGLLHISVAGKPTEIVPVAQLPFQVAHPRGPLAGGRHRL